MAYSSTPVNTTDNVMSSSRQQHLNYLTSAELTAVWKITYLGCLFGCSASLTTNPVIPVYTVDVVSRILEDWGLANICCCAYAAGPFLLVCLCVNVTSIAASTRVWVLLASEMNVNVNLLAAE